MHAEIAPLATQLKKRRRKRRDEWKITGTEGDVDDTVEFDKKRQNKDLKDNKKRKMPSKRVQRLHSLTSDLLFQVMKLLCL